MANEATIDELQIEISTSSGSAAGNLDDLAKSLDRLQAVTSRITSGSDGLNKVAKQIEKLNAISQKIQSMHGFEKLGKMVDQLFKLDRLSRVGDISGFVRNANRLPQAVNALAQMPSVDPTKFQQLADALKPLQSVNSSGINSLMNALRKLPKVSQELSGVDFTRFSQQIEQISRAIEPLARQAERSGQGLTAIAQIMQQTNRTARQSTDGVSLFNRAVGDIKVKTLAAVAALRRLFSALKSGVTASAAYVENLNLFSVTMGDSADEALRFAESVNSALGIDTSDWIRYQGFFQSIGKGFGIAAEQSDLMSKNLTQLSYDLSSFFNTSVDEAYTKIQSGFAGEMEPLRRLGFALDEATLKQLAYNKGIKTSFENMTQAQKAQLRYIAIMEQAGNIGVLGDMARTIDTASNGMRVFQARIQQFSRAVGNMLMPILSTALPYMTAFVQVLTEGAQAIANFFGFELPKIDFSDAQVSSGFDDITGAIDEATEANEKFKGSLASIDQLNIIGSDSESKNAANMGNQFDLGINLPEYDFLQGVESKTKQIAENIKDWFKEALPWIEAVGTAILGVFATRKALDFVSAMKRVSDVFSAISGTKLEGAAKAVTGIAGGLAAGATSGLLMFNGMKNLVTETGDLNNNINMIKASVVVAGLAMGAFIALGNPLGAVITGIGLAVGAVSGLVTGMKELDTQLSDTIMSMDNGGISIQGLADGFSGYFDEITSHYDDVLANTKAFEDNQSKISGAAGAIYNLTEKYSALGGVMTESDAQTLSDNIKIIGDSISTNLGTATQNIVDTLKNKFSDFVKQLGLDIDDMVGKFYLLQSMGNTALADIQKHAQELAAEISQSETIDPAKLKELDDTVKKMSGTTSATAESVGFERALQEMDFAKINFESADSVKQAITDIESKKIEAESTINKAWDAQLLQLQNTKEQYISLGVDLKFDEKFGPGVFDTLFSDAEKTLNAGYKAELDKITVGNNVFLAMVQQQFDKNADLYAKSKFDQAGPGAGSIAENFFANGGLFASGEDLYKVSIKNYTEEFKNQHTDIQELIDQSAKGVDLTQFYDVGNNLMKGMENGAINGQTDFNNTLAGVANGGLDTLETAFDINSPSKKGEEITNYLMQGLELGTTKNQNLVFEALDYTAVQSIMKLSKLKENMSAFKLGDIDTKSLIPDFSFKAPTISRAAFEQPTGTVREAYEKSSGGNYPFENSGTMEATVPINVQFYLDNDLLMEKSFEEQATMVRRTNGKPMW